MLEAKILELIGNRKDDVAVMVKDLSTRDWLIKLNEYKVFPTASTIKIPIMLEVLRKVETGEINLNQIVDVKREDRVDFSIISELEVKEYSVLDLITLMIIISDNTATNVLIDLVGDDSINNLLKKLGFVNTKLQRKMMDFEAINMGYRNTTTPMEMAMILIDINNSVTLKEHSQLALDIMKRQLHKDSIPRYLPDKTIIAHKTGQLDGLNHDIGIVYLEDTSYLIGVFTENAKENLENKRLIGNISKLVYDYFIE